LPGQSEATTGQPSTSSGFGLEGIHVAAANFAGETGLPKQRAEIKLRP